jgi:hypothetical protein
MTLGTKKVRLSCFTAKANSFIITKERVCYNLIWQGAKLICNDILLCVYFEFLSNFIDWLSIIAQYMNGYGFHTVNRWMSRVFILRENMNKCVFQTPCICTQLFIASCPANSHRRYTTEKLSQRHVCDGMTSKFGCLRPTLFLINIFSLSLSGW